jgi:hypothetical protein
LVKNVLERDRRELLVKNLLEKIDSILRVMPLSEKYMEWQMLFSSASIKW